MAVTWLVGVYVFIGLPQTLTARHGFSSTAHIYVCTANIGSFDGAYLVISLTNKVVSAPLIKSATILNHSGKFQLIYFVLYKCTSI